MVRDRNSDPALRAGTSPAWNLGWPRLLSSLWTDWLDNPTSGYGPGRYYRQKFNCSGHSWKDWATELKTRVEGRLGVGGTWEDDEAVDIIAHSQGGLAARQYVEWLDGSKYVRTLVMLRPPSMEMIWPVM